MQVISDEAIEKAKVIPYDEGGLLRLQNLAFGEVMNRISELGDRLGKLEEVVVGMLQGKAEKPSSTST